MGKGMKKKILLGSIIAVVVIVLTSFTSVVGFQSTESNSIKESPLFRIRTKMTINDKSTIMITSNYIGRDSKQIIPFPNIEKRNDLQQTILSIIESLSDKEFESLLNLILKSSMEKTGLNSNEKLFIVQQLKFIREDLNILPDESHYEEIDNFDITINGMWFFGCFFGMLVESLIILFFWIFCLIKTPQTIG